MSSLISIIVPVYNVQSYLPRCVESILGQTYRDFELILVDDGSPDRCGEICDEYADKDERIVVIHKENGGLSDARNTGLDWCFKNSLSQWITFVDSDDWIHPKMLNILLKANLDNLTDVAICGFEATKGDVPLIEDKVLISSLENVENFYVKRRVNAIVAWGKLYSRECFHGIRFPVGKIHEDEFTTYKILFNFTQISYVDAPLYNYFTNQQGIMLSVWNLRRLDILSAFKEQIDFFKGKFPCAYFHVCREYILALILCCRASKENYPSLHFIVKDELRKAYRHYRKMLGMNLENSPDVYNELFPVLMPFYWRWHYLNKFLREKGVCFVLKKIIRKILP